MQRQHFNHIYLADVKYRAVVWLNIQIFSKCQLNTIPFHSILLHATNTKKQKKKLDESAPLIQINLNLSKYDYSYMYTIRWAKRYGVDVWNVPCRMRDVVVCFMPLMFRQTIVFNHHTTTRAQLLSLFGSWSPIDSWLCTVCCDAFSYS